MAGTSWDKARLLDGTTHHAWTEHNCTKYTKKELAAMLSRSLTSVERKLKREGWLASDDLPIVQGTEATPQVEGIPIDSILQFMKDTPRSIDQLSEKFDRSPNTMRHVIEWLLEHHYAITQTAAEHHVWSTKVPRIVAPSTILWDKDVWEFKLDRKSVV